MSKSLSDIITRITRTYLNRSDLDSKAVDAIQAAIRHYQVGRYPWNETSTALTTTALNSFLGMPSDIMVLDMLEVVFAGANYELLPRTFENIQQMNATPGSDALPSYYCERGNFFILSPSPDQAYTVNCSYLQDLANVTATVLTATNAWFDNAEDVIVYHATKLMWNNVLRNPQNALTYAQLEREAFTSLKTRNDQRYSVRLNSTVF